MSAELAFGLLAGAVVLGFFVAIVRDIAKEKKKAPRPM